jgi:hypothetical protein
MFEKTEVTFGWKDAGLMSIWNWSDEPWAIHFFPSREFYIWGTNSSWWDGPLKTFGLGPLFVMSWRVQ